MANVLERQYLRFSLGNDSFAIDLSRIAEILELPAIAIIPSTESWLLGVINRRGSILSVVDIAPLLESRLAPPTPAARLIVISSPQFDLAIQVDAVEGTATLNPSHILLRPEAMEGESGLITGSCDLDGRLFNILNVDALLNNAQLKTYV